MGVQRLEAVILRGARVATGEAVLRDRGWKSLVVGIHRVVFGAAGKVAVRRHRQANKILLINVPCMRGLRLSHTAPCRPVRAW